MNVTRCDVLTSGMWFERCFKTFCFTDSLWMRRQKNDTQKSDYYANAHLFPRFSKKGITRHSEPAYHLLGQRIKRKIVSLCPNYLEKYYKDKGQDFETQMKCIDRYIQNSTTISQKHFLYQFIDHVYLNFHIFTSTSPSSMGILRNHKITKRQWAW